VVNKDLTIIDGHSRKHEMEKIGKGVVWVSVPDRLLTEKEYKEFNAVFDLAKAGEPDVLMIETMFGDEFMQEWDITVKGRGIDEEPSEGDRTLDIKVSPVLKSPKEKAIELYNMFNDCIRLHLVLDIESMKQQIIKHNKQSALMVAGEVLSFSKAHSISLLEDNLYWEEVMEEIKNLEP